MVERKIGVILILAGLLSLASVIMSLYSISTADWSTLGLYTIGLFQTCSTSHCTKNQYADKNSEVNSPPIFSKRFYNAAPLAIIGVFLQFINCFLCFLTAFIYLPPKPSLTCYITPMLTFIAFLFQFLTIIEASYGIHLNAQSSSIFESVLVIQVVILMITFYAADRICQTSSIQYV